MVAWRGGLGRFGERVGTQAGDQAPSPLRVAEMRARRLKGSWWAPRLAQPLCLVSGLLLGVAAHSTPADSGGRTVSSPTEKYLALGPPWQKRSKRPPPRAPPRLSKGFTILNIWFRSLIQIPAVFPVKKPEEGRILPKVTHSFIQQMLSTN